MSKKYIDIDQLFKCETCFHHRNGQCNTWCESYESYRPDMSTLEVVDAEPIVYGEWLTTGDEQLDNIYSGYKCSVCGFIVCGHAGYYCSVCGAKMIGNSKWILDMLGEMNKEATQND